MIDNIKDDQCNILDIDLTYLKEFSNGDLDFEKEILNSIIIDTDEMIEMFNYSIEIKDYQKIFSLAHSLKSLMNIMGSRKLHDYFYGIEQNKYSRIAFDFDCLKFQFTSIKETWIISKFKILRLIKISKNEMNVWN